MIDVSVIVPTHDRSTWLCQSLRSVLWQRDVDLEVIVVDDGSTDDTTGTVVKNIGDRRIELIRHETPQGVSIARNHGAEEAAGEWLAFLDDDDLWAPTKLRRQLQAATTSGCNWAYGGCVNVDATLRILGGRPPPRPEDVARLVFRSNIIPGGGSNVVVRRDTFQRVGPFDLRLTNTEDWEMWIRLAKQGPPAWVPEPLMAYRLHAAQSSLDIRAIFDGISLIERRHSIKSARGESYRWIASSLLRTGRRSEAMRYLALAAIHGQAPGVAQDVRAAFGWRLDRYLGRVPRTLEQLPYPGWTLRAQAWVNELATSAPC